MNQFQFKLTRIQLVIKTYLAIILMINLNFSRCLVCSIFNVVWNKLLDCYLCSLLRVYFSVALRTRQLWLEVQIHLEKKKTLFTSLFVTAGYFSILWQIIYFNFNFNLTFYFSLIKVFPPLNITFQFNLNSN